MGGGTFGGSYLPNASLLLLGRDSTRQDKVSLMGSAAKMKVFRQSSPKLVRPRQKFIHRRFFDDLKGPGTDPVKANFFTFFQVEAYTRLSE